MMGKEAVRNRFRSTRRCRCSVATLLTLCNTVFQVVNAQTLFRNEKNADRFELLVDCVESIRLLSVSFLTSEWFKIIIAPLLAGII